MIRCMLVEDQRLVRTCVAAKLESTGEAVVVAEAGSGEEALSLARAHRLDVVLMDLHMPGMGGVETTRRLRQGQPRLKILGLSMYLDGPLPLRFLRAGGNGYVSKHATPQVLIHALRTVARGETYISREVATLLASAWLAGDPEPLAELSDRELEVLRLLADGQGPADIASALRVSPKTVGSYRRRLRGKLAARNDLQLARIARQYGIGG